MTSLIIREWKGQEIRQGENGKMCLTDMSKSEGKKFSHWKSTQDAQEFLEILSEDLGIPIYKTDTDITASPSNSGSEALIEIIKGGNPQEQGTWGHIEVALKYAQWLNKRFGIQCNRWNIELMEKGKVELQQKPQSALEVLNQMMQTFNEQQLELQKQREQLEKHDMELLNASEQLMVYGIEIDNLKERIEDYRENPLANDYFKVTINQYCKMNNLDPSRGQSISVGRYLTRMCSILNIEFNNNENANDYPYWLLKALFDTVEEFNIDFETLVKKYLGTLQQNN